MWPNSALVTDAVRTAGTNGVSMKSGEDSAYLALRASSGAAKRER